MKKNVIRLIIILLLLILVCISIVPFYLVMVNATYGSVEIVTRLNLIPGKSGWKNYVALQQHTNIWRGFKNSLLVTAPFVLFSAYFGSLTAFGFAKYQFKGKKLLFSIVLASLMLPTQLSIIGFYFLNLKLSLINTFWPFIIPGIANASAVFFLRGMIQQSIPDSMMEAARMEGCTEYRIFHQIVLPCIVPGIATISIFNFVSSWNNYMGPLIILSEAKKFTMPILIATIKGVYLSNYGAMYMAILISIIPIILIYSILSRYIIHGLTIGAEK
nr:carbohydrate ABC transporter permease [uncultured Sphaerochaeta sp.]